MRNQSRRRNNGPGMLSMFVWAVAQPTVELLSISHKHLATVTEAAACFDYIATLVTLARVGSSGKHYRSSTSHGSRLHGEKVRRHTLRL